MFRGKISRKCQVRFEDSYDPGITWITKNSLVDVFLEITSLLDIVQESTFLINDGIEVDIF